MGSVTLSVKKFLVGTLIGIASMVPGVSGAVLAVCFGVYERAVAILADLRHKLKDEFSFIALLALGIVFGMFLVAFGLDFLFEQYRFISILLFTGLIIGQYPELWRHTEPSVKPSKVNIICLVIGFLIMCSFLFMGGAQDKVLTHDMISYLYMIVVGVFLAISKIAPGISGSTVLMAGGLMAPLTHAMTTFDIRLLIPLGIGLIIGLVLFSKVVNYALNNYRKSSYMMIFGLTVGSTIVMLSTSVEYYVGSIDLVTGAIAFVIGVVISIIFTKLGQRTSQDFALD